MCIICDIADKLAERPAPVVQGFCVEATEHPDIDIFETCLANRDTAAVAAMQGLHVTGFEFCLN